MEVIHVHPAAHIKPDLHEQVRVVMIAPVTIDWIGIKNQITLLPRYEF
jgi:hypothetical protein